MAAETGKMRGIKWGAIGGRGTGRKEEGEKRGGGHMHHQQTSRVLFNYNHVKTTHNMRENTRFEFILGWNFILMVIKRYHQLSSI